MIKREDWGAKPLTAYSNTISPSYRTGVVVHHSVTSEGKSQKDVEAMLRMIDNMHRSKGYGGIGYNLAVDYAGRVYEARGINIMGCHTSNANGKNYGVVYIGDGRERITKEAVDAIQRVVNRLQNNSKKKLKVYGHQDLWATACPGPKIQKLVEDGTFAQPYPPKPEKPSEPEKPKPEEPSKNYVIARPGDSYWKIAARVLDVSNTPKNYPKILKESKRIQQLNNNKPITPGMKVRIK